MGTMAFAAGSWLVSNVSVVSNACSDVLAAAYPITKTNAANGYLPLACSSSEVVAGTYIFLKDPASYTNTRVWTVEAIDAPAKFELDYVGLGMVFSFGFVTVLSFWLVAHSIGQVLRMVKR